MWRRVRPRLLRRYRLTRADVEVLSAFPQRPWWRDLRRAWRATRYRYATGWRLSPRTWEESLLAVYEFSQSGVRIEFWTRGALPPIELADQDAAPDDERWLYALDGSPLAREECARWQEAWEHIMWERTAPERAERKRRLEARARNTTNRG
jgi:hypothetical protein